MTSFKFFLPTKVIFGRGTIRTIASVLKPQYQRVLLVTDRQVAAQSGALPILEKELSERTLILFDQVEENPPFQVVAAGTRLARAQHCDIVIGVGGGSPMDTAKGIALACANTTELKRIVSGDITPKPAIPVVCIPTTSGTGSEVTPYAVFTDTETRLKIGTTHDSLFPVLAIVDPDLTASMPEQTIIDTGLDALCHAVEAFLSTEANPFNDHLSLLAIETIIKHLSAARQRKSSAQEYMAYAAMIADLAIAHSGTILPHIMGYPLTMYHHLSHGRATILLVPRFLDFLKRRTPANKKLQELDRLFKSRGGIKNFIASLGVSLELEDYGITAAEFNRFANETIIKSDVHITPFPVRIEDIEEIYSLPAG